MGAGFDPRWIDLALALVVVEGVVLSAWRRVAGAGPRSLIANLAAGGFLLILARELATGAGSPVIFAALTGALVAHAIDLAARWERKPKAASDAAPATGD